MIVDNFTLTKGQIIAVDKISKFLESSERLFLLIGKAGTGKTFIIKHCLSHYISNDMNSKESLSMIGVTVSHKAKEQLRASIPYVNTFASTFGQREILLDDGTSVFKRDNRAAEYADCNHKWKVAIMDECSMYNKTMLNTILEQFDSNTKIILMGDAGQLPPIEEDQEFDDNSDSPVFQLNLPDFCKHELTERVRQTKGNSIIDLSDNIYNQIFGAHDLNHVRKLINKTNIDENGFGYQPVAIQDMYDLFANSSSNNFLDTKLLAYRRITVNDYNRFLRNYIHYNPIEYYIPDEIIYMNKNFRYSDGNQIMVIHNSSEYVIQKVTQGEIEGIPVDYVHVQDGVLPVIQGLKGGYAYKMFYHRLEEYSSKKLWLEKRDFKDSFAEFNYGYTLTMHKAQGSTYDNVFVDVDDIFAVRKITAKRKLQALYTAITRASKRLYFIESK